MTAVGLKRPRQRDDKYLAFVRKQPCCVCGWTGQVDAAHIRMASTVYGKRSTGAGEKPDDKWCVPLCSAIPGVKPGCHKNQHSMGEADYWRAVGLNPFEIARNLYAQGGNPNGAPSKKRKSKPITPKGKGPKIPSRPFDQQKRTFR